MGHSIELHLSKPETERLTSALQHLEGPWQEPDFRPHLSLAVIRQDLDVASLQTLFNEEILPQIAALDIQLSSVGLFTGRRPVLFLGATANPVLLRYHELTIRALAKAGIEPIGYYLPGYWTPHVTLSTGVASGQLETVVRGVTRSDFAGTYRFGRLDLIEFHPAVRLESVELPEEATS